MDVQGCWWCGVKVEQKNHFCSPNCFYIYHEASKHLDVLEYQLRTLEADLTALDRYIAEFDQVAPQVNRLSSDGACGSSLQMLHSNRDAMSAQARSLQQDVACLQQRMASR